MGVARRYRHQARFAPPAGRRPGGRRRLLYTIQALWTAAHERVPVVAVVLNNRSYRILKQRTRALGGHSAESGKYLAMDLADPEIDLVGLARASASTP